MNARLTRTSCVLSPAAAFIAAAAGLAAPAHAGPVTLTLIAASRQPAPGIPSVTFDAVADPRVDDLGHVTFWARLAGTGVDTTNDTSIWSNRTGAVALVLREGAFVPGTGDLFVGLPTPQVTPSGELAMTASVGSGAFSFPTTLAQFTVPVSTFTQLFRESAQVPVIGLLAINDTGAIAFRTGDGAAIYSSRTGPVATVVKSGDPAPGAGAPGNVFLMLGQPARNAFNQTVFWAGDGPAAPNVTEYGIWSDVGSIHPVALTGFQALGLPPGVLFAEVDTTPRIDAQANAAFWARLSGPGVDATNDGSIWRATGAGLTLIVREGAPAPSLPGLTLASLHRHVELADSGRILFDGAVSGPGVDATNNGAIWASNPTSGLDIIAREGAQAPELPAGVLLGALGRPGLTSGGRIAFLAQLRGTGVTQTNSSALFATDGVGILHAITRTGDTFTVAAGDVRTIAQIVFDQGSGQTGLTQYSGPGQLVCRLVFTDQSSAIVSALVAYCPADFNSDGFTNGIDYDLFMDAYVAGDPSADFNHDGFVNGLDQDQFADAFAQGC